MLKYAILIVLHILFLKIKEVRNSPEESRICQFVDT